MISASLTAYAFARLEFRFKRLLFALMLMTLMLPGLVTLIPQYVLFLRLEWINTFYPLWVPRFFVGGAFFIFLNRRFIRSIPPELDEVAELDGESPVCCLMSADRRAPREVAPRRFTAR